MDRLKPGKLIRKDLAEKNRFSRNQLIVLALTFSLIGGAILLNSYADNPNLTGDINNDNKVDVIDLSSLLSAYGTNNTNADLNDDGVVNILDLSVLLTNYNRTYTPSQIWDSSLKDGDSVPVGTTWTVSFNQTPSKVDFWVSGSLIATDTTAPFSTPLNLSPGQHNIGFCYTIGSTSTCAAPERQGIVASVTLTSSTPTPPPTPPPPASGNKLKWAPPTLTNPITINVSNTNRAPALSANQDYIIKMPNTPLTARGGLVLNGGRNIVIIGGEIRQDTLLEPGGSPDKQYGIYTINQTGTLHIEGMHIHGQGLGQGIVLAQGSNATVQVQNTRIETLHPVYYGHPTIGEVHTDGFQSWAGPYVLRIYNVTIRSIGLSLQMSPYQYYSGGFGQWHYENLDMYHLSNTAPALARQSSGSWWAEYHKEVWLDPHPQHGNPIMCNWTNSSLCWNPGNGSNVTGESIKIGVRPGGNFAPLGIVGLNYVSPGYQ